jgi:hypothetical protein
MLFGSAFEGAYLVETQPGINSFAVLALVSEELDNLVEIGGL